MITGTSSMPCASCTEPNVNRRSAEIESIPTVPSARPSATITKALRIEPPDRRERSRMPAEGDREVFRGPELNGDVGEPARRQHDPDDPDGAGDERPDGGDREGGARPALPRHLVAVEQRDDRAGLAGDVDEDRRGRAAVHGAVVDAREHDQRGGGMHREGGRQEEGHGADGPDAGQHADDRADQDADEAREQIAGQQRDRKSVGEAVERSHPSAHQGPRGSGTSRSTAKSTYEPAELSAPVSSAVVQRPPR